MLKPQIDLGFRPVSGSILWASQAECAQSCPWWSGWIWFSFDFQHWIFIETGLMARNLEARILLWFFHFLATFFWKTANIHINTPSFTNTSQLGPVSVDSLKADSVACSTNSSSLSMASFKFAWKVKWRERMRNRFKWIDIKMDFLYVHLLSASFKVPEPPRYFGTTSESWIFWTKVVTFFEGCGCTKPSSRFIEILKVAATDNGPMDSWPRSSWIFHNLEKTSNTMDCIKTEVEAVL